LKVDRQKERVGLSRKRLLPDPWHRVADRLQVGQVVEGKVTNVAKFGIFVDLGEGVEGLVHTSEIPDDKADSTSLESDSPITVRVLKINPWNCRIALSLKDIPATTTNTEASPALTDVT
jgi:ribosomal protein S1